MVQTLIPNLVLIGYMGTGKSTIGRACARALGFRAVDTDAHVERRCGRPIADIFAADGEAEFRRMEALAVEEAAMRVNVVIATGGGVVLNPGNVDTLRRSGVLMWLRVAPEEIVRRCGDPASRPLLASAADPLAKVKAMLTVREPLYSNAADAIVETTGLRREDAATLVLDAYRRLAAAWPTVPGRDRRD